MRPRSACVFNRFVGRAFLPLFYYRIHVFLTLCSVREWLSRHTRHFIVLCLHRSWNDSLFECGVGEWIAFLGSNHTWGVFFVLSLLALSSFSHASKTIMTHSFFSFFPPFLPLSKSPMQEFSLPMTFLTPGTVFLCVLLNASHLHLRERERRERRERERERESNNRFLADKGRNTKVWELLPGRKRERERESERERERKSILSCWIIEGHNERRRRRKYF